jgi:hypothetical protein
LTATQIGDPFTTHEHATDQPFRHRLRRVHRYPVRWAHFPPPTSPSSMPPAHEARPAGCWAPKDTKGAIAQTSGRDRLNIHGGILETGKTKMLEVLTVNAASTIALLTAIMFMFPLKRWTTSFSTAPSTIMPK